MILTLRNNSLFKSATVGGYASTEEVSMTDDLSSLSTSLLTWLHTQIVADEQTSDVIIEKSGDFLSAAVSLVAPQGQRTIMITSDSLPDDLKSGLLGAWSSLEGTQP
jgi:hypothetical protein